MKTYYYWEVVIDAYFSYLPENKTNFISGRFIATDIDDLTAKVKDLYPDRSFYVSGISEHWIPGIGNDKTAEALTALAEAAKAEVGKQ